MKDLDSHEGHKAHVPEVSSVREPEYLPATGNNVSIDMSTIVKQKMHR